MGGNGQGEQSAVLSSGWDSGRGAFMSASLSSLVGKSRLRSHAFNLDGGVVGRGSVHTVSSKESRKIPGPSTEFSSTHARGIALGIRKYTKDLAGKDLCDRLGHANKMLHKKVDRILEVESKG